MTKFANILGTVGNTPVVKIGKLAPPGVDLYVKIEAFNPLGSVKDRLALGVIEDAERSGALKPGQTVIEASSGNTGIGLAMVCAQKGYPLVVTMAESFSVERRKLMRFLGARVVLTPAAERGTGMVKKAVELAEKHGWFLTRQFENEANADVHSRTTAREIVADFAGERLDYWVTGFGTGGTIQKLRHHARYAAGGVLAHQSGKGRFGVVAFQQRGHFNGLGRLVEGCTGCGHLQAPHHVAANHRQQRDGAGTDVRAELPLQHLEQRALGQVHLQHRGELVVPHITLGAHRHGERDQVV